ncbi:MAG: hypothetical protein ACREMX_04160 [Gemmatimonadales bacterium]
MNRAHSFQRLMLPGFAAAILSAGCGEGEGITLPPLLGRITVSASTDGPEPDPDGYALLFDGVERETIAVNGTALLTAISPGQHTVGLSGIAANCTLSGDNPRPATAVAGATTAVDFALTCSAPPPAPGVLRVITTTSGDPAPDSYLITLDGQAPQPIGVNADLEVINVAAGVHTVELSGLTGDCVVADGNPRTVAVPSGGTVEVTFSITCGPGTGSLLITTATSGSFLDPDGYTVRLDGGSEQAIGINATLVLSNVPAGPHTVELSSVASNCQAEGGNVGSVTVVAGLQATVPFSLMCTAPGVQRWTPMPSGTGADLPDIWGSSGSDVFTVGESITDEELASVVLHYDGNRWLQQFRQENLAFRGVWGASGTEVFAVGDQFADVAIFRYDGRSWSEMAVPGANEGEERFLESVWGSSATDVFAVGSVFDGLFETALILRYDRTRWTVMRVPGDLPPRLADVWGSAADDVYAVGETDPTAGPSTGMILHFDGGGWSLAFEEAGVSLKAVWGSSRSDVFAVGSEGAILHYDGSRWSRMTSPTSGILFEIWGSSATDVFAVGDNGIILHYDGTSWTATTPTTNTLLGVWGSSPSDLFAVGNGGTILHGTP